ncbi:MAG: M48 family metalloprotease [Candidatus Lokiarchaeota archaeon]|nr:M48 family metalloprotease [Candidatus Lokiarchaeota archaeon]MBD3202610.1 M48 family metalloprotease [Candidatus Lokiarchaeota archaeon]
MSIAIETLVLDWSFITTSIVFAFTLEEFYRFARNNRRSELSDIIAIFFFFILIYFFSKDILTSIMGAFSIYLWIGVFELKDYPVINKILIISLITYNFIFIAGLFSSYFNNPRILNTSFAFSFWMILGLGFLLFGRKYLVVFRFISPQYLTLFLYIIGWLLVVFIDRYTPLNITINIYIVLILTNILIYMASGPLIDKMLGIKRLKSGKLVTQVDGVKKRIGIKKKVKVGFAEYPILNAMAYGAFFDKRIAIIAENIEQIEEDELRGIIAHELAHSKSNHTLILAIITITDLIIRMLVGFPATYYDYAFGDPNVPLLLFILINLGIYTFLYIFVRILEGYADRRAKNAGYKSELAKALYNLESYYASGREIGLNTMLLCEEKITENNKMLDYIETANYINKSLIKPSRASLLSNFLNSHPLTYHRIVAILNDKVSPIKEAFLPFICLRKSKQKKYAKLFEEERMRFKDIANKKFKERFEVNDISGFFKEIKVEEVYEFDIGLSYLFRNKIEGNWIFGKVNSIEITSDITDNHKFRIIDKITGEEKILNSALYEKILVNIEGFYFTGEDSPLKLRKITIDKDEKNGNYIFTDINDNIIKKSINKFKLPYSIDIVKSYEGDLIFFYKNGEISKYKCQSVKKSVDLDDYILTFSENDIENNHEDLEYKINELIIKPNKIQYAFKKNINKNEKEISLLNWLCNENIRTYFYLKKPVNNLEIGYLEQIKININNNSQNDKNSAKYENNTLSIRNIFGESVKISLNDVEFISFKYKTGIVRLKSEISLITSLSYKILNKFRPRRTISHFGKI